MFEGFFIKSLGLWETDLNQVNVKWLPKLRTTMPESDCYVNPSGADNIFNAIED